MIRRRSIHKRTDVASVCAGDGHALDRYISPLGLKTPDEETGDNQDGQADAEETHSTLFFVHFFVHCCSPFLILLDWLGHYPMVKECVFLETKTRLLDASDSFFAETARIGQDPLAVK